MDEPLGNPRSIQQDFLLLRSQRFEVFLHGDRLAAALLGMVKEGKTMRPLGMQCARKGLQHRLHDFEFAEQAGGKDVGLYAFFEEKEDKFLESDMAGCPVTLNNGV